MDNKKQHLGTCFVYELVGTTLNIYGWMQVKNNWLAGGANLMGLWCACHPVSGAVFNPAQTLRNFVLSPRLPSDVQLLVVYLTAQFIGGFLAVTFAMLSHEAVFHASHEIDNAEWLEYISNIHLHSWVCFGDCRWL